MYFFFCGYGCGSLAQEALNDEKFPYLEDCRTHQVLHTHDYIVPLRGNSFTLNRSSDGRWWIQNLGNPVETRAFRVESFEKKSYAKRRNEHPDYHLIWFLVFFFQILRFSRHWQQCVTGNHGGFSKNLCLLKLNDSMTTCQCQSPGITTRRATRTSGRALPRSSLFQDSMTQWILGHHPHNQWRINFMWRVLGPTSIQTAW